MKKQVLGGYFWAPNMIQIIEQNNGISMIFIFANARLFDDILRLYEFQEKLNIQYYLGRKAKSEDCHDDLIGSQGRNIEH